MTGKSTATVPFGSTFADAMAISWYRDETWSTPECTELAPLALHPAAHVLHYASTCFEGLKAYRWEDGSVYVFRLERHIERMRQSAELVCLPQPDASQLREMICRLVDRCRNAIPVHPGALYLRPTLIGDYANIGSAASPSRTACLYVIASPVGEYFKDNQQGLRIVIDDENPRSTREFGMAKTGGNYASALRYIVRARTEHKADQVLFCPHGDVQETGAANFLLLNNHEVLTKALDSSFLHGVTRDSVLALAAGFGYEVNERDFLVSDTLAWVNGGGEAALSGTAAGLAGIGTLIYRDKEYPVTGGVGGVNTERLQAALRAIQSGHAPDQHGWLTKV